MDAITPLCSKTIKEEKSYRDPRDPTMPFRCVALEDVGKAVTQIILRPANHEKKVYHILGPSVTMNQQTAALSKASGKDIKLVGEDYEQYRETLTQARVPEWSIHGTFEIYQLIDEAHEIINMEDTGDYEKLTQEKPTSLEKWCMMNKAHFK